MTLQSGDVHLELGCTPAFHLEAVRLCWMSSAATRPTSSWRPSGWAYRVASGGRYVATVISKEIRARQRHRSGRIEAADLDVVAVVGALALKCADVDGDADQSCEAGAALIRK